MRDWNHPSHQSSTSAHMVKQRHCHYLLYNQKAYLQLHVVRVLALQLYQKQSFQYPGVHITQNLSWICHTNTQVYLRRLRNFYPCTTESILMGNICTWFGNSTKQDRQDLQGVLHSAHRALRPTHHSLRDS